jgi:hypothetical protein
VIDGSRLAIDLNALDDGCGYDPLLRFVTIAHGSLDLEGCTHLDEPERYACGVAFRFACPAGDLDRAGTPGTWEVVGYVGIDDPRDGPVGLADVTLWAAYGTGEAWAVCDYQAEVDAWPYTGAPWPTTRAGIHSTLPVNPAGIAAKAPASASSWTQTNATRTR